MKLIKTQCQQYCPLCGKEGDIVYHNLVDQLFNVPGKWAYRKCDNTSCEVVWMDPMPSEQDLGMLYSNYYTHNAEPDKTKKIANVLFRVLYNALRKVTGIEKRRAAAQLMFLGDVKPGRILDVGCGDGSRLALFKNKGWNVEGQEVDPKTVKNIQNEFGIKVHHGALESLKLPDNSYDAIVLNHVIEHVVDSISLLSECFRLLKINGHLVVFTPNVNSLGHKFFKASWRGLEVPRHLKIYSPKALEKEARSVGFTYAKVITIADHAEIIYRESSEILSNNQSSKMNLKLVAIKSLFFQIFASICHLFYQESGEECVLKVKKQS